MTNTGTTCINGTLSSKWVKISATTDYRWKLLCSKLCVATPLMASKSEVTTVVSQPDIANYIQRQRTNSVKRALSSPTEEQPHKKSIMEVTSEVNEGQQNMDRLAHLPPDLKLLYDSLSVRLDSKD